MPKGRLYFAILAGAAALAAVPAAGLGGSGPISAKPPRCIRAECPSFRFTVRQANAASHTRGAGTVFLAGATVPIREPGTIRRATAVGLLVHEDEGLVETRRVELRVRGGTLAYRKLGKALGAVLSLSAVVSESNDAACAVGSKGRVVLKDSVRDAMRIRLPACHSHMYISGVRVKITRPRVE